MPITADTTPPAAAAIAARATPKAAIISERTERLGAELRNSMNIVFVERLFREGDVSGDFLPGEAQDLAILAFTSGSTGQPRAVELTHKNLLCNLDALLQVRQVRPGDALLSMLPPAHLFELMAGLLAPLACGARVVYAGSLLPNRLVEALRECEITEALAVPALVGCLYEEVADQLVEVGIIETSDASPAETARRIQSELGTEELQRIRAGVRCRIGEAFRTLIVGGAAVDPAMAEVIAALGIRVEVGYGLTEASPIISTGFVGQCPLGSAGHPLPGIDVQIDECGEILVRGPNVMRGYFKDPRVSAAVLQNGWLKTGDYGRLDEAGFLFVCGRLKEAMVTAAGETLWPEEVEPYYVNPLFAEVCVAALRGRNGNDLPTLFVVPASPELKGKDLEDTFASLRAAAPARFRVDRIIRLREALPKTASGKIQRRILVQQFNRPEEAK